MIDLVQRRDGVVLPVRAQPGARSNCVRGIQDGALKVAVTQVAEKGKANKAIALVLGKALGLKRSQIDLISGRNVSQKQFLIRDVRIHELRSRINAVSD